MPATVTINAVQPRRATRVRQRQTLGDASHQAKRGQELQLQNYTQCPMTLHFIHSVWATHFVMQFRCIAHQIEWQSLMKEGVIDIEDIEQFYAKL